MGRVVASGEQLWQPEDTLAVLAYLREEDLECPGCGLPREETMDRESDGRYRGHPIRCHACAARERTRDRFSARPSDGAGLFVAIEDLGGVSG
jgi:predicted RNA-binding Zn-ribbon protein involved in translation (DUF1610 family)